MRSVMKRLRGVISQGVGNGRVVDMSEDDEVNVMGGDGGYFDTQVCL